MKLTRAGEYAVRCVLYLASQGQGALVSRRLIADYFDIPASFLAKIAQQLAKVGLIDIRQGAKGGYVLLKNPADITMLEVVEAIIGEIALNDCVTSSDTCRNSNNCAVNRVWTKARNQLRATLAEVTFIDLLHEKSCFIFPQPQQIDISKAGNR
ncbi:MAG: Rrf2 family transcriptional regulator [Thermodesulfobacteriota bacterium]